MVAMRTTETAPADPPPPPPGRCAWWVELRLALWPHPVLPRDPMAFLYILGLVDDALAAHGRTPLMSTDAADAILAGHGRPGGILHLEIEPLTTILDRMATPNWTRALSRDPALLRRTAWTLDRLRVRCATIDHDPEIWVEASLVARRLIQLAVAGIDPEDRFAVEAATVDAGVLPPAWGPPDPDGHLRRPFLSDTITEFGADYDRFAFSDAPWRTPRPAKSDDFAPDRIRPKRRRSPSRHPTIRKSSTQAQHPHAGLDRICDAEDSPVHTSSHVSRLLMRALREEASMAPSPIHMPAMIHYLQALAPLPATIYRDDATVLMRTVGICACLLGHPVRDVLSYSIDYNPASLARIDADGTAVCLHLGGPYEFSMLRRVSAQDVRLTMPEWTHGYLTRSMEILRTSRQPTLGQAIAALRKGRNPLDLVKGDIESVLGFHRDGANRLPSDNPVHLVLHHGWLYVALRDLHLPRAWAQFALGRIVGSHRAAAHYYSCSGQEFSVFLRRVHSRIAELAEIPPPEDPYPPATAGRVGQQTPTLTEIAAAYRKTLSEVRDAASLAAFSDMLWAVIGRRPTQSQPHPGHHVISVENQHFAVTYDKNKGRGRRPRLVPIPKTLADAMLATRGGQE